MDVVAELEASAGGGSTRSSSTSSTSSASSGRHSATTAARGNMQAEAIMQLEERLSRADPGEVSRMRQSSPARSSRSPLRPYCASAVSDSDEATKPSSESGACDDVPHNLPACGVRTVLSPSPEPHPRVPSHSPPRPGFRELVAPKIAFAPIEPTEASHVERMCESPGGHLSVSTPPRSQLATLSGALVHKSSRWHDEDKLVTLKKQPPSLLPPNPDAHMGESAGADLLADTATATASSVLRVGSTDGIDIIYPADSVRAGSAGHDAGDSEWNPYPIEKKGCIKRASAVCCSACVGSLLAFAHFLTD